MENRYRNEYISRINRVIDYINQNIYEPLDLETLADVAAFSKYHFHKVFGSMAGESIGSNISRLKLEKAAASAQKDPAMSCILMILQKICKAGIILPSTFL